MYYCQGTIVRLTSGFVFQHASSCTSPCWHPMAVLQKSPAVNTKARKQMPQAHARPSANDCFGDACGQRRLGGAGPAGVPLVVLHGFGGASGVLRSCRRSADPISTISGASGVPFAPPGCRRPRGMLQQALLCCFRRSSNMLPLQRIFAETF